MKNLNKSWKRTPKILRQIIIIVPGTVIIVSGLIMLIAPGPGWLTIFLGLAVLATEFVWAKRLNNYFITNFKSVYKSFKKLKKNKATSCKKK